MKNLTLNKNTLYLIATPIGNLLDVSFYLVQVLKSIPYILCEDTRNAKKLLNLLEIDINNKELISYHKFNENQADHLIDLIKNNPVAIMSDAGYVGICDPGFKLINQCIDNNIKIEVINGPCALIHSLVKSGFRTEPFIFLGFLNYKNNKKISELNQYSNFNGTIILYESVHRLEDTIKVITNIFINKQICIAKELTKLNEKFFYFNNYNDFKNLIYQDSNFLKGEFVILINNYIDKDLFSPNLNSKKDDINNLLNQGIKKKEIAKIIAKKYNLNTSDVYLELIRK